MAGPNEAILNALQDALVTVLSPAVPVYSTGLQATDGGAAAAFPYVHIGVMVMAPWDTSSDFGQDFTVRLHTKWRGGDQAPGRAIQDTIYSALHYGELSVEAGHLVLLQRQSSTVLELPDGGFDGICEYRGIIETI